MVLRDQSLRRKREIHTRTEGCRFIFDISEAFYYENPLEDKERRIREELGKATNLLEVALGEFSRTTELFKTRLEACENVVAQNNAVKGFTRGVVAAGAFAAGYAMGSVVGPDAAMMSAQMTMGMVAPHLMKLWGWAIS